MAVRQLANDEQSEQSPRARRCFIAAQPKTNLKTIRALLAERGIEATASYERPWIGARPFDTVIALIDQADLVIGVLDDTPTNANLLIELGYAIAREKKIMVVVPPTPHAVPDLLAAMRYLRANLTDTEAIAYHLDALLDAPASSMQPYIPSKAETHAIGDLTDDLVRRLSVAVQDNDGAALERLVADALRDTGVSIIKSAEKSQNGDARPDFGIWSDDLESSLGNPLLIELKMRINGAGDRTRLRKQVESYLRARSVEWGLVLYADGPPQLESVPPVVFLHVAELLSRLRNEGFAEIMSDLYGQAIRNA
jgi:hypothetical protein